jgi:beta-glucosidase
VSNLH